MRLGLLIPLSYFAVVLWLIYSCAVPHLFPEERHVSETPLQSTYWGYEYDAAEGAVQDGQGIRFDGGGWVSYVLPADGAHLLHVQQSGADYVMVPEDGKRNYKALPAPEGDFYYDARELTRDGNCYLGLHLSQGGSIESLSIRRGHWHAPPGLPVLAGNRAGYLRIDGSLLLSSVYPPCGTYLAPNAAPTGVTLTASPDDTDTVKVALFHGPYCSVLDCATLTTGEPTYIAPGEPVAWYDAVKRLGLIMLTPTGLVSYNSVDIYGQYWRYGGLLDGPHPVSSIQPDSRVHTDGAYLAYAGGGYARMFVCEDTVHWSAVPVPLTPASEVYPLQGALYPGLLIAGDGKLTVRWAPDWEPVDICPIPDTFDYYDGRIACVADGMAWVMQAQSSDLTAWWEPEAVAFAESLRGFLKVGTSGEWPYADWHLYLVTDDAMVEVN